MELKEHTSVNLRSDLKNIQSMVLLDVITTMDPAAGGLCEGIRILDKMMKHNNVQREVVCLDSPDSEYLSKDQFTIHALGGMVSPWRYNKHLKSWLEENLSRFDAVIINGLWQYHSYATWKAIKEIKKNSPGKKMPRVFVMPHGMLDPYFQRAKDRRLKAIRNELYWNFIEKHVINEADGLLFTCETEKLLARTTFKQYHPKKEYNVGYGIVAPPEFTDKMKEAFHACCVGLMDSPYLLFLSRIHPKKGLDLLLNAYIKLFRKFKGTGQTLPKLVIAGPGMDTGYGKLLLDIIAQEPLVKEDIYFPGMLSGDAKWGAYYECEGFILPSHQENFGIAVTEALACSKPVLISNQVNIWREIESKNGGIIEDDTEEGVLKMLERWINLTEVQKSEMAENAQSTFKEYFKVEKTAQNLIQKLREG